MIPSEKLKKETVCLINKMIANADKGPSGFWADAEEGCGNPDIFPEFDKKTLRGKSLDFKHTICPWNTAVMYGYGHGDPTTGCYYSCSIGDARYLSEEFIKSVLIRYKNNLLAGKYDNTEHIEPLLLKEEVKFIERQKHIEKKKLEQNRRKVLEKNSKEAAWLLEKYKDDDSLTSLIVNEYKTNCVCGGVDFSPDGMKDIVGGEKLSYNDYIDIQIQSRGKQRPWLEECYYNCPMEFKGTIERKTNKSVLFKSIFVGGMYMDGSFKGFDGKEDHIWMNIRGFEKYEVGDSLSFFAYVYRYIKTGNGKILDYSLRNPAGIKKIESYELPSEDDLIYQRVDELICNTCFFKEYCFGYCMMDKKEKYAKREELFAILKGEEDNDHE